MNIKVGELVSLYRRISPGLGIVVECSEDVIEDLGCRDELESFRRRWLETDNWSDRVDLRNDFIDSVVDSEKAQVFLTYNTLFWNLKDTNDANRLKTQFVRVKWLQTPSNYGVKKIRSQIGCFPADWLKKVQ